MITPDDDLDMGMEEWAKKQTYKEGKGSGSKFMARVTLEVLWTPDPADYLTDNVHEMLEIDVRNMAEEGWELLMGDEPKVTLEVQHLGSTLKVRKRGDKEAERLP